MQIEYGPADTNQQLEAVNAFAQENYENGWDLVIEAMSKAEIQEVIKGAKTRWGAIDKMSRHLAPQISYRREIEATAF